MLDFAPSPRTAPAIETIYGNLKGLKPSQLKQLRRLYQQRLPGDRLTTPEFAQRLAAVSTELQQPVSTYLNRRGQVIRVGVGSLCETQIPLMELPRYGAERLSGIRCVTTELKAGPPKESQLTAMALQRLDALVTLELTGEGFTKRGGGSTGYVKTTYLAHLIPHPEILWEVLPAMSLPELGEQDFLDLVEGLEAEFRRQSDSQAVEPGHDRVLIVGLFTERLARQEYEDQLTELQRLVESAGGDVLRIIQQKRSRPHPQTVVGEGKIAEIALAAQSIGASVVVFNRDLLPVQVRNLERQIGIRVVDRTEVILDIFAQRAKTGAGKLQVELAQLEYQLPRLTGRGQAMSRQGGGIGTRGPGETQLETERRAIQRRMSRLQQGVNQLQAHRARLRERRQRQEVPTVALVGYTNAGKSTLLNVLTQSDIYAADQLFATLDPTTRKLRLEDSSTQEAQTILLTDTVGFIHELPPPLVDAFRATLEEVTEADALIHLVDLSHPAWQRQVRSVMTILSEMPVTPGPILLVLNKMDAADHDRLQSAKEEFPQAVFISAREQLGLTTLKQRLSQLIDYAIDQV